MALDPRDSRDDRDEGGPTTCPAFSRVAWLAVGALLAVSLVSFVDPAALTVGLLVTALLALHG